MSFWHIVSSYFSFEGVERQQQQQHQGTELQMCFWKALEGVGYFTDVGSCHLKTLIKKGGCGQVMLIPRTIKFLNKTLCWPSSGIQCFWSRELEVSQTRWVKVAHSLCCDLLCGWKHTAGRPDRLWLPPYVTGSLLLLPGISLTWRDHITWAPVSKCWRLIFDSFRFQDNRK